MKCFVTGASGFVGANLVEALNHRGHAVKALLRPGSDKRALNQLDYETVEGDLTSIDILSKAMRGCDWCFHVAASYHLWLPDYKPMYDANVQGTRNVVSAATRAGCTRIVYTSTVGTIGLPDQSTTSVVPSTETSTALERQMSNPYKHSKWLAEQVALELAKEGSPVIVVNPSAPVGPRDAKPTPTGKVILDFLRHAMPAYLDTGLNWVHVKDVAVGHILAAERGRIGDRYILGNQQGNWTMKDALEMMAKITGIPAPRFEVPYSLALAAAHADEFFSRFTGKPPKAPLAGVRMAKYKMYFDSTKAIRELGFPQTCPETALRDAIEWFRTNKMTCPPP